MLLKREPWQLPGSGRILAANEYPYAVTEI